MAGLLRHETKKAPDKRARNKTTLYTIVIAGDRANGKTSLMKRFVGEAFNPHELGSWVMPEFRDRTVDLDGVKIKLLVCALGVYERSSAKITSFKSPAVQLADGAIILYRVDWKKTFDNVPYWIENMKKFGRPNVKLMVVGTGCDGKNPYRSHFVRAVDYITARELADEHQLPFFEVSAKDGTNVELAFMTLIQGIRQSRTKPTAK